MLELKYLQMDNAVFDYYFSPLYVWLCVVWFGEFVGYY
jgi:hypothetical protein